MSKPDGGPAFPNSWTPGAKIASESGMTLRDYLAAHAPAFIDEEVAKKDDYSVAVALGIPTDGEYWKDAQAHRVALSARWRYEWADAMIAERERES